MNSNVNIFKLLISLVICFFTPALSQAERCYYAPRSADSGIERQEQFFVSHMCRQSTIDRYWRGVGFTKRYWDDGFGYYDVCNVEKPLARVMGSIYLLENSYGPEAPNIRIPGLRGAYPYVISAMHDLRQYCHHGRAAAYTYWGPFIDDRTELYWSAIYANEGTGTTPADVVSRAALILHESHHAGAHVNHNCGRARDRRWEDWRPYASETWFLISYARVANRNTNRFLRRWAAVHAFQNLVSRFCQGVPDWVTNALPSEGRFGYGLGR